MTSSSGHEPEPKPNPEPAPAPAPAPRTGVQPTAGAEYGPDPAHRPEPEPEPRVLCDARAVAADPPLPGGVLWKLAEAGRQLDANLVRLAPGGRVAPHAEPELDVLVFVVAGDGVLGAGTADEPLPLAKGATVWLPHGSTRSITAGPDGLSYLTVHRRRPGLWIRPHGGAS
ncbi:procyclic form-specific polypeptide B-alpha [Streptomyces sp. GMY01]|uniref:cupin domain-containing protein n=1 Tax=Streptomyces sp. GMY02 TaxID=1333528 RepID=UPI00146E40E2|nr:procyclic form-specific polypeptide B-alpha [Streptomyces sp. GMY02]NMO33490.1 procyclic form-specific polypeptide B-alpha [Streptomyces sp. GMY02]